MAAREPHILVWNQGEMTSISVRAAIEAAWAYNVARLWHDRRRRTLDDWCTALITDHLVMTWPRSLLQKLPWGPEPHFGPLGGLSGFDMEAALDQLDCVVADTVGRTGRTFWTDLAWRTIARLGTVQRRCPDCLQRGPQGQMVLYGAIYACDLCQGVRWGGSALY